MKNYFVPSVILSSLKGMVGIFIVGLGLFAAEPANAGCNEMFVTRTCSNGYRVRFGFCPGKNTAGGLAFVAACASYHGTPIDLDRSSEISPSPKGGLDLDGGGLRADLYGVSDDQPVAHDLRLALCRVLNICRER